MINKKERVIKNITVFTAYLFVVWGFYRLAFKLPEEVEEMLIKPLVWLVPVFLLLKKEKRGLFSIGITSKNLFPAIYLALTLGVLFAIEGAIINFVKYGGVEFSANIGSKAIFLALIISLATAISEEIAFRGYIFSRIWQVVGGEWKANLITSFIWALIHLPVTIFWWKLSLAGILGYLLLTLMFGIGSAFVYARTKNVTSSILLHVLWEWPIVLFR